MPVDYNRLQTLLVTASEKLQQVRGKNLVLVMGRTGAGKSTLINYLQGYTFSRTEDENTGDFILDKLPMDSPPLDSPEIGHGSSSKTLYPDIYPLSQNTYVCDTAGFGDNRGETEELFAFLAIQIAVKAAAQVKAVVAVVEEAELGPGRGAAFKEIAQTLSSMFRGSEYSASLLMVFNKGRRNNLQLLATMNRLKTELDEIARDLEYTPEARQGASSVCGVLSMFSHSRNVIALDPTTEACRQALSNFIDRAQYIPEDALGIAMDTTNSERLKEALYGIVTNGRRHIRDRQTAEETINRKIDERDRISLEQQVEVTKIQAITGMLSANDSLDSHEDVKSIAVIVEEQRQVLCGKDEKLGAHDIEIHKITQQLNAIESDTTESDIGYQSYDERTVYGTVYRGTVHTHSFYFNTTDVPITRASPLLENGTACSSGSNARFYDERREDPHQYRVMYDTPSDFYGIASCRIYAQKRHTSNSKATAINLRCDLQQENDRRRNTQNDRERESAHLASLQQRLGEQRTATRAQLEDTKSLLEGNVQHKTVTILVLDSDIRASRATKQQAEAYLNVTDNKQKFKMLFIIAGIMKITDPVMTEFRNLYGTLPEALRFAELPPIPEASQIPEAFPIQGVSRLGHFASSANQPVMQTTEVPSNSTSLASP